MVSKTRLRAINALREIKRECQSHTIRCKKCPFCNEIDNSCEITNIVGLDSALPESWDVDESVKLDKEGEKWSRSF